MRLARPVILVGLAAQANSALLSVTDGVTVTVSACEPTIVPTWGANYTATVSSSGAWLPPNATNDLASTELVASPTETGPETTVPTAGAMPRPFESSIVGLIGFFVVSLIVL